MRKLQPREVNFEDVFSEIKSKFVILQLLPIASSSVLWNETEQVFT